MPHLASQPVRAGRASTNPWNPSDAPVGPEYGPLPSLQGSEILASCFVGGLSCDSKDPYLETMLGGPGYLATSW